MAFIPIIANADIDKDGDTLTYTAKKGKITPIQMAQIFSWCLGGKVGILDCLDRCEAENQTYTFNNENQIKIKLKPGFISIFGHIIENTGSEIVFDRTIYTNNNGIIVLSVNLGNVREEEYKIDIKPNSDWNKEDLNENTKNGKYDFVLYHYSISTNTLKLTRYETATPYIKDFPSIITNISKDIKTIEQDIIGTGMLTEGTPPLQNYDRSKGTIEERLTALGFNYGGIYFANSLVPYSADTSGWLINGAQRQGNFVIAKLSNYTINLTSSILQNYFAAGKTLFRLLDYRIWFPKNPVNFCVVFTNNNLKMSVYGNINSDGRGIVTASVGEQFTGNANVYLSVGFEAKSK